VNVKRLLVLLLALAACGGSSATAPVVTPVTSLVGTYALTAVDGVPLPVPCVEVVNTNVSVNGGVVGFTNYDTVALVSATLTANAPIGGTGTLSFITVTQLNVTCPPLANLCNPYTKMGNVGSMGMTYTRADGSLTLTAPDGVVGTGSVGPSDATLSISDGSWCLSYGASNVKRFDFRRQ
jgi:hypothetical protein